MPTDAHAFVHAAELLLDAGADPAAPGGAVTAALCGRSDHEGPCHWPHNNDIDSSSNPARFRTLFVADPRDEDTIRQRIDRALRDAGGWRVLSSAPRPVAQAELPLARRLQGTPRLPW